MSASEPPGPLIGAGRAADVYAIGAGRVLRRYRTPFDVRAEAEMMRYLGKAGFPVPAVYDADGSDLVMERLDGRDMLAEVSRRPWLVWRHARTLAELHNRLHQIAAPPGWPQVVGPGGAVLHLDLHPGNVMLTSRGPVVIDWSNVRSGPAGADVAMAYLIMASSEVSDLPLPVRASVGALRGAFIRQFLIAADDDPAPHIATVARHRMTDRNVRPAEAEWLGRKAAEAERAATAS
ncbi:MAG TPA: phosphotransferase [Streptosporangiaceae bacterium]|nr:phosphotransferase [Streptosporangiaceae bacterium]